MCHWYYLINVLYAVNAIVMDIIISMPVTNHRLRFNAAVRSASF
jgi:hypothetical protein